MMFKPDVPIKDSTSDLLERLPFSASLANAIISYEDVESLVVGLYGKWGSGKSSVINMCIERIEQNSVNCNEKSKPIIVRFNPWNFSDQNQLISQFFIQLSSAIRRIDKGEVAVSLADKLQTYASFFKPLALVSEPTIATSAGVFSKTLWSIGNALKKWGGGRKENLEATREDIDEILRAKRQKVLIFIDDIDRLTGTEIRQIFQLVKLLGDFPNTVYILSLDDSVVVKALKPVQPGIGTEYLEKIIQIPFHIPTIDSNAVHKFLMASINQIIDDVPENLSDPVYWGNIFQGGLKNIFTNLRDVIRFINVFKFAFDSVKNDVNAIDFIVLIAFQVFEPDIYRAIAANQPLLAGLLDNFGTQDAQASLRRECDSIIDRAKRLDRDKLKEILKLVFPKLEKIYDNKGYTSGALNIWRRQGRVCSPDKFAIYFRLTIGSDDISEIEMTAIISETSDRARLYSTIQQLNAQNRINRFLTRIYDYLHDIPTDNIPNIVHVLLDLGDSFPDEESFRGFGVSLNISQILTHLIDRIDSQELRYQIIQESMSQSNSLHVCLTYLYSLGWNHGKWTSDGRELAPEDRRIVSVRRLAELEDLVLQKIREYANTGNLANHSEFLSILYRWKDLSGGPDEPRSFTLEKTRELGGAVDIVCAFAGKVYSYGLGDHVARENIRIDMDSYQLFSDPKFLADQVRPITESPAPDVTPDKLAILKAFIKKYDEASS